MSEQISLHTERAPAAPSLAQKAADMFIRVSMQNSASVGAQGAAIALELQRNQSSASALKLGDALLNDEEELSRVLATANSVHRKKVTSQKLLWRPLVKNDVVLLITDSFTMAHENRTLSPFELQAIIDFTKTLPKPTDAEGIIQRENQIREFRNALFVKDSLIGTPR